MGGGGGWGGDELVTHEGVDGERTRKVREWETLQEEREESTRKMFFGTWPTGGLCKEKKTSDSCLGAHMTGNCWNVSCVWHHDTIRLRLTRTTHPEASAPTLKLHIFLQVYPAALGTLVQRPGWIQAKKKKWKPHQSIGKTRMIKNQ